VLKEVLRDLADVLFPPRCHSCRTVAEKLTNDLFCPACEEKIRYIRTPLCPACGIPYDDSEGSDHLCGDCLTAPKPFAVARSVAAFDGVLLEAIHAFKYHNKTGMGTGLGRMMTSDSYTGMDMQDYTIIMPVPLHIRRLRERGFNQSLLLAKVLSASYAIPLDFITLRRERDTPPQTMMGRKERQANIKGAFGVTDKERVRKQRVLLIDDVYTTGSTLAECARVLLNCGAAQVGVLTLARAIKDA
jgi:ComF family protein